MSGAFLSVARLRLNKIRKRAQMVTHNRFLTQGLRRFRFALLATAWSLLFSAIHTVPATAGLKKPVNVLADIAPGIAACWHAPHENDEITIRLSFTRQGMLIGRPRIMFMKSNAGADGEADLANSMMEALHDCTPLAFTDSFGAAVAGRVFTLHFTNHHTFRA